jgi:hypothetical protein
VTARKWVLWSLQRSDGSGLEVDQGTEADMAAAAARRNEAARRLNALAAVFAALPAGQEPAWDDIPPLPGRPEPEEPPAAERTVSQVTDDLVTLALAGIVTDGTRGRTAARVRELCDEMCSLAQDAARARARKSLAAAWGAWLELAMAVKLDDGESLLAVTLDLAPERLRAEFKDFVTGRKHG